jgi:hypothetical protein
MTSVQCLENLPASEYHAMLERQSCSMLKWMLESPAHYLHRLSRPIEKGSRSMDFGTLVHLLVLEPYRLAFDYEVVAVRASMRQSSAKRKDPFDHRVQVTEVELHEARTLADRILHAKISGRPFARFLEEGKPELTLLFEEEVTGVSCRSRLDLWHPEVLFDVKTTRHNCPVAFRRSALELHYDMQAFMYGQADAMWTSRTSLKPFYFLAAENAPPYTVQVVRAGESFLENGQNKFRRAIALVKACAALDHWPDTAQQSTLEIEPWQAFSAQTVAGEAA